MHFSNTTDVSTTYNEMKIDIKYQVMLNRVYLYLFQPQDQLLSKLGSAVPLMKTAFFGHAQIGLWRSTSPEV